MIDILENNIQEKEHNIQTSFNNYFISILKELPDFFKNYKTPKADLNIKRYLKSEKENKELNDLLPINIINSTNFILPYTEFIKLLHRKPNKIPHFTKFEQNEVQILYLLENTFLASEKINKYKNDIKSKNNPTNNHLIKINNIIKSNPDLIGYIYILQWLKKIICLSYEEYNTNESLYEIINNKKQFSEDTSDPIKLEEICQKESNEDYNNLMKQFTFYFFKGNITACQDLCEERKIEEFANVFSGGCPLFDKVISNNDDYNYFDKDLISPSMINKDYQEFIDLFEDKENDEEKNIYGNSLYILWMQVMYQNADFSKNGSLLNYIFRIISGNYKNYELNNNNIYEYLYINVLNLLHSKIFSELTLNPQHKMIQYHYIEPDSFKEINQVINNGGRNIFNIIDSITENNNYALLCKKYPLLWLELCLIKLFFIKIELNENLNEENIMKYLSGLNNILNKMKSENDIENSYLEYNNDIINNEREFNYTSLNNKKMQAKEFYDMIKICFSRIYFSTLVNFYNIENSFFEKIVEVNDNILGDKIEEIFSSFDEVYMNHIKNILNLEQNDNLNLDIIIYIITYMFNIKNIIFILTEISHYLSTEEKYKNFIFLIKKFFEKIKYKDENLSLYLIRIITNNSNLLSITEKNKNDFNNIDDALIYYIKNKNEKIMDSLSDDDKYKINQIICLFDQSKNNKLNIDTSYSYLLKLFIKFLVNYKFKEAYELKFQLSDYVYDLDTPTDDLVYDKINLIDNQIEKINDLSDEDELQFTSILVSRFLFIIVLDCFYFYANQILIPYNDKKKNKNLKKNYLFSGDFNLNVMLFLTKKLKNLNEIIKKIIKKQQFFNFLINYYGENTKNDFIKLLADWYFQSVKWTCDIFQKGIIDKNKNDSLKYLYHNLIEDFDIINNNYNENGILGDNLDNDNNKENKIYEILNEIQKQKIVEMMYYMTKINRNFLEETFDEKFIKELNEEKNMIIQDLEFDE